MLLGNAYAAHALDAPGNGCRHFAGYHRVFRVIFKIPAAQGIAVNIETRRQPDGHADLQHLPANRFADLLQKFRVPGLRLYGFAGPRGHIAVDRFPFSRDPPEEGVRLRQPSPLPVLGKPLRIPGNGIARQGAQLVDVQPGRAIGHSNVGNAFFQKLGAGSPCRAHDIIIAPNVIAAAHYQPNLVPIAQLLQHSRRLGRYRLRNRFSGFCADGLYRFQHPFRFHAEAARRRII